MALGLIGGVVLGCGAALIRDRRSGLVFSEEELKSLLPCALLERLPAGQPEHWATSAQLLIQNFLSEAPSVALIPVGDLPKYQLTRLKNELEQALGNRQLLVTPDLLASRSYSTQLLVTAPGSAKRLELHHLREQLALQGTPLAGWLLIEPAKED